MSEKLPYVNGDVVAVPLRDDSSFGLVLIVGHDGVGAAIGYLFDSIHPDQPTDVTQLTGIGPENVLRASRFGDLGLMNGTWLVVGQHPSWQEQEWPLLEFGGRRWAGKYAFTAVYEPEDVSRKNREEPITEDEYELLPRDAFSGSGAVEIVLTHLLSGKTWRP